MRLVLKEKKLQEEKIGDKFYLYHSTITQPDLSFLHSFRKGVQINLSRGMAASQGAGFYLWQIKKTAVDRLYSDDLVPVQGYYDTFNKERDGNRLLVTIATDDLNLAKFTIDNEVSAGPLIGKMIENFDKIEKMELPFQLKKSKVKENALTLIDGTSRKTIDAYTEGDKSIADKLGAICKAIGKQDQELWLKIEREVFAGADAIKYIGQETIIPEKLEIYTDDHKVIDVTTKDP